jgi:hypothetical protein
MISHGCCRPQVTLVFDSENFLIVIRLCRCVKLTDHKHHVVTASNQLLQTGLVGGADFTIGEASQWRGTRLCGPLRRRGSQKIKKRRFNSTTTWVGHPCAQFRSHNTSKKKVARALFLARRLAYQSIQGFSRKKMTGGHESRQPVRHHRTEDDFYPSMP